ncbi:unnamed protein product [Thelazia callipaeda]|uniref:Transmembrane protein n=1 Tax=Thelazia callipaeda TaxID=103827 RepID=A0A0N5CKH8_THECL|nr:unnamed protein product [Thelazia callipaeda]
MSSRSMHNRLEVLRNGQDVSFRSLHSSGVTHQQIPNLDGDNESHKSDSWVDLANPSSQTSLMSINAGDNGSVVLVDSDEVDVTSDNTMAGDGGNGTPVSHLSPISSCGALIDLTVDGGLYQSGDAMTAHSYGYSGSSRNAVAIIGMSTFALRTKRTAEWLESYNSRPEKNNLHLSSPVSTPPNSLVLGLDVGELSQSSFCDDDEVFSFPEAAYFCKCQKLMSVKQRFNGKKKWIFSGLRGLTGNGCRALVLCLVTNLVTLAIGFAVGLTIGRKLSILSHFKHRCIFDLN